MSESSENDRLQLSWVERRAWLVQTRLLAAASISIDQGLKRTQVKAKNLKVISKVIITDRVEDLEKLGHSIFNNTGFWRCKFCFRGSRKTGLVKFLFPGESASTQKYSNLDQLPGGPSGFVGNVASASLPDLLLVFQRVSIQGRRIGGVAL